MKRDEAIIAEVAGIRYKFMSSGKIAMEKKEETKKRVGGSPDRADMLAMLFDSSCEWVDASGTSAVVSVYVPPSPAEILRREMEVW